MYYGDRELNQSVIRGHDHQRLNCSGIVCRQCGKLVFVVFFDAVTYDAEPVLLAEWHARVACVRECKNISRYGGIESPFRGSRRITKRPAHSHRNYVP